MVEGEKTRECIASTHDLREGEFSCLLRNQSVTGTRCVLIALDIIAASLSLAFPG